MRMPIIVLLIIVVSTISSASAGFNFGIHNGYPVTTGEGNVVTTPDLWDITGSADLEVIVTAGGSVYVYSSSGDLVWKKALTSFGLHSSPVIGDISGDGAANVVIGGGWKVTNDLSALTGSGTPVAGFPKTMGGDVWSTPTLADIDDDDIFDIIIGCDDGKVYSFNGDGTGITGWPVATGGAVRAKAAVGDIDGDMDVEIIAASKDGNVYAWHADGTSVSGYPKNVNGYEIDEGSVALGDLDGDGVMDVVVPSISGASGKVFAWGMNGDITGWPVDTGGIRYSTPSIGDVDGDGDNEVVVGSSFGDVYVFEHDGSLKWHDSIGEVRSKPLLIDLNNNGKKDIIITSSDGNIHIWYGTGEKIDSLQSGNYIQGSSAVADIDNDGALEVAAIALNGNLYVWDIEFTAVAPNVSIESPGNDTVFEAKELISFKSNSTDNDGTIVLNEWYSDRDGKIGTGTSFSRILSEGLHIITLTCEDNDGIIKSAQVQIKVEPEIIPPGNDEAGGGGGGAGGSGATGENFENIAATEVVKRYVSNGVRATYLLNGTITEVNFLPKKTAGDVGVVTETLHHTSALVDVFPSGMVYRNVNIWVGLSGYATEQNIGDAHIKFKVAKDWILSHDIDKSSIGLQRYHENTWISLSTQKIGEDVDYIYYSSQTPGFSPFVITGQKSGITITEDMLAMPVEEIGSEENNPTDSDTDDVTVKTESKQTLPSVPFNYQYVLVILAALGILLLLRGMRRSK